jgi:hypothetical protein
MMSLVESITNTEELKNAIERKIQKAEKEKTKR